VDIREPLRRACQDAQSRCSWSAWRGKYATFSGWLVRYFSIRESARLQTFPDNFVFQGSWTESMRQIGNAVQLLWQNI